jgi:protease-4
LIGMQVDKAFDRNVLQGGEEEQTVAVYTVAGVINDNAVGMFAEFCRDVMRNDDVRAVVLRVESPGGGVSQSDQMAEAVSRLKASGRKVVVSLGGVAASGGYYIAARADEIVAEPTTWTGSIGVIAQWPIVSGTLDKIGMKMVVLKSRHSEDWKDQISPFRDPSPEELARLREMLNHAQARFEGIVLEGRGRKLAPYQPPEDGPAPDSPPKAEAFNGKIYLAEEAKALGLVDRIGYGHDAIDRAASLAGLSEPHVVRYEPRRPLFARLMGAEAVEGLSSGVRIDLDLLDELQTPRVQYLWRID